MSMYNLGIVKRNIVRADPAAVEKLSRFGVATIHEAMGRTGLMQPYLRPIYPGARICGSALTVLMHPHDNWMLHVAAEEIRPGDIVVAAVTAECTDGYFGELLATSFRARSERRGETLKARLRGAGPRYVQDARAPREGGTEVPRLRLAERWPARRPSIRSPASRPLRRATSCSSLETLTGGNRGSA